MMQTISVRSNKPGQRRTESLTVVDGEPQVDAQVEALVLTDWRIIVEQIVQQVTVNEGSD